MKNIKIFLSHANEDTEIADRIKLEIKKAGVQAFSDAFVLSTEASIRHSIRYELSASDFLIVLLSPAVLKSSWLMEELKSAILSEWHQRAISLITIKVRPCRIPNFLAKWITIDATRSFSRGIDKLIQLLRTIPQVDLHNLKPHQFEELMAALLKAYGFRKIRRASFMNEYAFDIGAEYHTKNPFGQPVVQEWLVEVKSQARKTDISVLRELLGATSIRKKRAHVLFITSSQLTSAAREWIDSIDKKAAPSLTVLEGTDVLRLLLAKPKLIHKFFGQLEGGDLA